MKISSLIYELKNTIRNYNLYNLIIKIKYLKYKFIHNICCIVVNTIRTFITWEYHLELKNNKKG